jgi:ankyrin repeat protein
MSVFDAIAAGDLDALRNELPGAASARNEQGVSALLFAIYHRNDAARDALLDAGAPVGPAEAAALGRLDGLDPAARSGDGFASLHLAAFFGGAEAVRALLAAGADPDADDANPLRVRPIHSAVAVRDHDATRALLEAGANPNVRQERGFTPLHSAAHSDDAELTRLLLDHGADASLATDDGQTAADMAGDATRGLLSR